MDPKQPKKRWAQLFSQAKKDIPSTESPEFYADMQARLDTIVANGTDIFLQSQNVERLHVKPSSNGGVSIIPEIPGNDPTYKYHRTVASAATSGYLAGISTNAPETKSRTGSIPGVCITTSIYFPSDKDLLNTVTALEKTQKRMNIIDR